MGGGKKKKRQRDENNVAKKNSDVDDGAEEAAKTTTTTTTMTTATTTTMLKLESKRISKAMEAYFLGLTLLRPFSVLFGILFLQISDAAAAITKRGTSVNV